MNKQKESPVITHVTYDTKTGRIIHIHRKWNAEKGAYVECDPKKVMSLIDSDQHALSMVTDGNPKNLGMLVTTDLTEESSFGRGFWVDTKAKKLMEMPRIILSAEKAELEGDGKDSMTVEIKVEDGVGNVVENYRGTIKVTTSRGKLSTKGGLVKLKKGRGSITLTSVNETVNRVSVVARCLEGRCVKGDLDLEFV